MSENEFEQLSARIEPFAKLANWFKVCITAIVAVFVWQASVEWRLSQDRVDIDKIKTQIESTQAIRTDIAVLSTRLDALKESVDKAAAESRR